MSPQILLLSGDNFTASTRTPWGGERLAEWKRALGIAVSPPLGESWEVSFGPELPSMVMTDAGPVPLQTKVDENRAGYLGDEAPQGTSALLVKLLDAGAALSVQIHPHDDDPLLGPGASGKPECWYVAAAEPGAFVLFGLEGDASDAAMRHAIENEEDVSRFLHRFEVEVGDFFVVPPGTPHAIGPGVTVVEPQHVAPNKRGVTYRYWDWNRRYDVRGRLDPAGQPRPLHIEDALRVTDWVNARGSILKERAMLRTGMAPSEAPLALRSLCHPRGGAGALCFPIAVERLSGTGTLELPTAKVARSLTMLEGALHVQLGEQRVRALRAQSLLVPAGSSPRLEGDRVVAILASVPVDDS